MGQKIDISKILRGRIRLIEVIIVTKEVMKDFDDISEDKLNKLESSLSNSYDLMKLVSITELLQVIFNSLEVQKLILEKKEDILKENLARKYIEKNDSYQDFTMNIKSFEIFSERIWPAIIRAYFCDIKSSSNKGSFILRISIPRIMIENKVLNTETFLIDLIKWLKFHNLGIIKEIKDEDENINIKIEVIY